MADQVDVEEVKTKVHELIVQADKEGTLEYVFIFPSTCRIDKHAAR